jgi:hypothetical protein
MRFSPGQKVRRIKDELCDPDYRRIWEWFCEREGKNPKSIFTVKSAGRTLITLEGFGERLFAEENFIDLTKAEKTFSLKEYF